MHLPRDPQLQKGNKNRNESKIFEEKFYIERVKGFETLVTPPR